MIPGKLYKIKVDWVGFYSGSLFHYLHKDDIFFLYSICKPPFEHGSIEILSKNKFLEKHGLDQYMIDYFFEELK